VLSERADDDLPDVERPGCDTGMAMGSAISDDGKYPLAVDAGQ
jgi:hypothetical protein